MAEARSKRRSIPRSASCESADVPYSMGKPKDRKHKKPKERWLLTRKTWRYMADAGRKLIPEGVQNRPEDIPKIEAYFQEMCKREPRFLLWRKNSYPGAMGFRSRKRKERIKGGSCRKATSADEIEILKPERPTDLPIGKPSSSRFDIQKLKEDFLNKLDSPADYTPFSTERSSFGSSGSSDNQDSEEKQLIHMLEQYLSIPSKGDAPSTSSSRTDLNYQELVDKLQRHLTLVSRNYPSPSPSTSKHHVVHFEGDYVQKTLSETLSRYFGMYPNRDKVISDLLTDRRALEKLYFELRKAKGFRSRRGGTGYPSQTTYTPSLRTYSNQRSSNSYEKRKDWYIGSPPPLIEIHGESVEVTYHNWGTQTTPIPEEVLHKLEEEYKKTLTEKEEEEKDNKQPLRRKSSVDHDDVSQSVSETIKRYLRMARKKSVDTDKVDRFKRVNYDRNLRNIKAKGEITKPGDDDGLNKGCQTNDDWILTYRDLKFDEIAAVSETESRGCSSRSSIDAGLEECRSSPSSPPALLTSSHSFLSNLLHHGKHHDKNDKNSPATATGAMQKSKSSSSVMHHGSRLMAKRIFRSRSKSQTRPSSAPSSWTPQVSSRLLRTQ